MYFFIFLNLFEVIEFAFFISLRKSQLILFSIFMLGNANPLKALLLMIYRLLSIIRLLIFSTSIITIKPHYKRLSLIFRLYPMKNFAAI